MNVGSRTEAIQHLQRVNYYRLSGYWYSFRQLGNGARQDTFFVGTSLEDVMKLYDFDARLRTTTFDALAPVELGVRAALGHALGEVDECAHLKPELLNVRASRGNDYNFWLRKYERELVRSHEDFVSHHENRYGGTLPIWVAVEILDWGIAEVSVWVLAAIGARSCRRRFWTQRSPV
ncbi:Abi family protein [Rhodoglobus aureus]|uniref:Abi family protein n=1 Tax=Rhodoglobus aureus TaxID=191497 RepID=UPI0031E492E7